MSATARAGADGKISRDDIERKFRELQGETDVIRDEAMNYALVAGAAVAVAVVGLAFLLGRRKGKRSRAIVEIRRL